MKNTLLFFLLCCKTLVFAQIFSISYKNPTLMNLCDTSVFEVTIKNSDSKAAALTEAYIELPIGVNYLNGSVQGVSEKLITSSQIVEFTIGNIGANSSKTFTFKALTTCSALSELNKGVLFSNVIIARNGSYEVATLTEPYTIETPLPIIVAVTDPFMKAGKGETIERIWTIENTRKGRLRDFRFEDNHDGGMIVTTNVGKIILSNAKQHHLAFGAADFKKIGDGDAFFEEGEQIVIKEKILITDCGVDVPKSVSKINIVWGCPNSTCNTEKFTAIVDILRTNYNPNLVVEPFYQIPEDYCGIDPFQQAVTITNTGKDTAYNVVLELRVNIGNDPSKPVLSDIYFDRNSFTLLSPNGNQSTINPFEFHPKMMKECQPQTSTTDSLEKINLPIFAPGASYKVQWKYLACLPFCKTLIPAWKAAVTYTKTCPKKEVSLEEVVVFQDPLTPYIESDLKVGKAVKDGEIFTAGFQIKPESLKDSTGVVDVEFTLPCGFTWLSNSLTVSGVTATNITKSKNSKNEEVVKMTFPLPLKDTTYGKYQMQFNCKDCATQLPAYKNLITDCPEQCIDSVAYHTGKGNLKIKAFFKLKGIKGCGIPSCSDYNIYYDCTKKITQNDTVAAYALSSLSFNRSNFGLPDNDNDRLPDGVGTLDFTKMRLDHFIPGDTAAISMKSEIFTKNKSELSNVKVKIAFERHIADLNTKLYGTRSTFDVRFIPLNMKLKIYSKKLNKTFNCPLPEPIISEVDTNLIILNITPTLSKDGIHYFYFNYIINPKTVNCLPSNFKFGDGDSLVVNGSWQILDNLLDSKFTEARANTYRVKVGTSIYNTPKDASYDYSCICTEKKFTVSGYGITQTLPKIPLLDCFPTLNKDLAITFGPILNYPNFFPYEYRRIAKITKINLEIPSNIQLVSSVVRNWSVLGGKVVFTNQNVPFVFDNVKKAYTLDISSFQNPMQDEGFSLFLDNTYQSFCQEKLTSTFNNDYFIEPTNSANPKDTVKIKSPIPVFTFDYNKLTVKNLYDEYNSFDNTAVWELLFENPSAYNSPNPYLFFSDIKGIKDVKVVLKANGTVIPVGTNGIYNLPDVGPNSKYNVLITAINQTCDEGQITVNYGWNCTPVKDTSAANCVKKKYVLYVSPTPGEVEMRITSPKDTLPMCSSTDYAYIDISSVRFGSVFNPTVTLNLPKGLSIQPGSCQIAYPANSANFVNIADPVNLTWNLADLVAKINQNGLAGVGQKPNNAAIIRFKFETGCGFLSGKNFTGKIQAFEICGKKTNELTRAGKPVFIKGVVPIYDMNIQFKPLYSGALRCDQQAAMSIRAIPKGVTGDRDSIYVFIPKNVQYIKYDIVNNNSPKTGPDIQIIGNQQVLKWKIPANVGPGAFIGFILYTKGWGTLDCNDETIKIRTTHRQETTCVKDGSKCSEGYLSGETSDLLIDVNHPSFAINPLAPNSVNITDKKVGFSVFVKNQNGADSTNSVTIDLYADLNTNGKWDKTSDLFLGSQTFNFPFAANGKSFDCTGQIDAAVNLEKYFCNLLLVIDGQKNCACSAVSVPITKINYKKAEELVCSGTPKTIGVSNMPNHFYNWQTASYLSCSNCANPTFLYNNLTDKKATILYTFTDTIPKCYVTTSVTIVVPPKSKIVTPPVGLCKGESATLKSSDAKSYQWSGANLNNATTQSVTVTPTKTSLYKVTITDDNNCVGIDSILVKVGGGKGSAKDTICAGKSKVVNGITYNKSGTYDIVVKVTATCDSLLSYTLTVLDTPQVTPPTLIKMNEEEEKVITGVAGAFTYLWTPPTYLSCSNCPTPTITKPKNDVLYTLKITDKNGCATTRNLQLKVVPNCSADLVRPVLAFAPDGMDAKNRELRFTKAENENIKISLKVFNRWGEIILNKENVVDPRWDGTFSGKPAPSDVYVILYKVSCGNSDNDTWVQGEVTLIR
jgi:gliding motility-associated-like protein